MTRLEYREYDEASEYPLLYVYPELGYGQLALRFACDYFIKDGKVYEQCGTMSGDLGNIIYVRKVANEHPTDQKIDKPDWRGIRVELRRYRDGAEYYPLIRNFDYENEHSALVHLLSGSFMTDNTEWLKTSAEVDEDRLVYVYYAQEVHANG